MLGIHTIYDERLALWVFSLKPNKEGSDYEVNSDEVLRGGDICGNSGQTIDQADYPSLGIGQCMKLWVILNDLSRLCTYLH